MSRVYTGKGDDGSTGLLFGGRVPKDHLLPEAYGTVDEAQASIGLARAATERGGELDQLLVAVEHDLYVLMAELATQLENRTKLVEGQTLVDAAMVEAISARTDELASRFEFPTEFVVPGQSELSARLDVARTVVRRAERRALPAADEGSHAIAYLNRLSSLLWTAARWVEADDTLLSKSIGDRP